MSKLVVGFRYKDGNPLHDADCFFWSHKVCTCGLLHALMCKEKPNESYSKYEDETVQHDDVLRKLRPD